ncbi:thioesterase family protein [Gracilibacillus salinarum]|uniref:Thioesterase family protein n=1 Tax=Gracilibacillus salinarum TaxID=2932255 RepID=A0ABY4GGF7_9BACI|nr:thioesterase family protein [Gracilibacillus salinarum]UOQ83398.1 thioesterase family protein [Gracilibacillus salinarum]
MPNNFTYKDVVRNEWVDYNGHMNDAAYAKVFSLAVDALIDHIGLDEQARRKLSYSIFTLETHICYLQEAHETQEINVTLQLLNKDAKRLHVFFEMYAGADNQQHLIATSEQMLMGMDMEQGRPAPFPETIAEVIDTIWNDHKHLAAPKQAGRQIGIK